MGKYVTKQRTILLSFLRKHPDRQYSVEHLAEELCAREDISKSSIYRNINDLVADGMVSRCAVEGSRQFRYQYIGTTACKDHMHLKCESCGQLFHMENESMDEIRSSVKTSNGFNIDISKTILYGICDHCE